MSMHSTSINSHVYILDTRDDHSSWRCNKYVHPMDMIPHRDTLVNLIFPRIVNFTNYQWEIVVTLNCINEINTKSLYRANKASPYMLL